jgi:predicted nucleic acid-binding protein
MYLVDTNVLSEARKGSEANPGVVRWYKSVDPPTAFVSVFALGEIRRGVLLLRRRDPDRAASLQQWLDSLLVTYAGRILPLELPEAMVWASLTVSHRPKEPDVLIGATALYRDLTVVTRNVVDFERLGVRVLNPFD